MESRRYRSLFWPVILIGIGVLWLLGNLGIIEPVSLGGLLRFWPVLLIVAGLDMDFRRVPFGPMPALCAVAEDVYKVHAICVRCGALAYVSHRLVDSDKRVLLGEMAEYEPICRDCFNKTKEEKHLVE